ncbi:hypothetical protein A3A35_00490 [Candidatus Kaiserbacteria bacterium RIFCSPLOWO2_01_FULL_51_21]|uniref:DUF5673 domain-containing protein n=1 Tax=Candidatus Kaiserbacteria bacterium RIFCSPLOWO2_01_FULL_51_21 TaxID=1798508 RepID=A0A1F6ED79_9BACT|nr:MAG: hypothetical protein A3A35_00490 [Candidatus Kaiserbacteria bacterium RIFCSPLOWO2_01_FULL_51_21]
MDNNTSIVWDGYEYEFRRRSSDWYWALLILTFAGAATAFILDDPLFALIILIGAFALALFAAKKPVLTQFAIQERGIKIDTTLYPYETLESFWIAGEERAAPRLIIKSKKVIMPFLIIPLDEALVENVDRYLKDKLPREEHEEPMSHRVMEMFGF